MAIRALYFACKTYAARTAAAVFVARRWPAGLDWWLSVSASHRSVTAAIVALVCNTVSTKVTAPSLLVALKPSCCPEVLGKPRFPSHSHPQSHEGRPRSIG